VLVVVLKLVLEIKSRTRRRERKVEREDRWLSVRNGQVFFTGVNPKLNS